jgi:hypothetical protein
MLGAVPPSAPDPHEQAPGPQYVTRRPHPALAGLVLRYTGYREFSAAPLRRRQAPVGSCTLILSLGPPLRLFGPAGPSAPASFLAGMHDAAVLTEFAGRQHGVQVDLTPLGAYTLLGRPMSELANRVPRLDELAAPALTGLDERLADAPDWPRRFARLDAALLAALAPRACAPTRRSRGRGGSCSAAAAPRGWPRWPRGRGGAAGTC